MKNAVILHGTGNNPEDNWFRWLENELIEKGYEVWVPELPDADEPNLDKYSDFIFNRGDWEFNKETVLIGHSSGVAAALMILEKLPEDTVINKAILVAGFFGDVDFPPNKHLKGVAYDLKKIRNSVNEIILFHSDNDPYVDIRYGKELEDKLHGELILMKGQKHFSISTMGDKYKKFPELLEYL